MNRMTMFAEPYGSRCAAPRAEHDDGLGRTPENAGAVLQSSSRWTRKATRKFARLSLASCAILLPYGCAATKTGNPVTDGDTPQGIELVRSKLERETEPMVSSAEQSSFGDDSRDFALELYAQVAGGDGNLCISPYSLWAALGMLYAGAEGETQTEMMGALHFNVPEPDLYAAFNATDLALNGRPDEFAGEGTGAEASTGDLELKVVNGAFTQRGMSFTDGYLDTLAQNFGAGVFTADFESQPDQERLAINQWVEDQTETRIQDLLPQGSIDSSVKLVLANALYFKGSWLEPFDASLTANEVFHAPSGDVQVPMMNGYGEQYMEGDGYKALVLPYITPALGMLFVLPDDGRFDEIEGTFDRNLFDETRSGLSEFSVTLKIPKFTFESTIDAVGALKALGMQRAFISGEADLSGIASAPGDLYVDNIFHKTFVAVDEQGTEAAAATALIARATSAPPPAEFFLDRPFLFVLYDEPTGQILFVGRVLDPS